MSILKKLFSKNNKNIGFGYSKNKIIKLQQEKYYKHYPNIPYFKSLRDSKWEEMVSMFPKALVAIENMKLNNDGLFPGDIIILYWINKYSAKKRRIPDYFEFEYGIDFVKRKSLLYEKGFIDAQDNLTHSGEELLKKYNDLVKEKELKSKGINFINIEDEIKRYHEETKMHLDQGYDIDETLEERIGYLEQKQGINLYKLKKFDEAEMKLLSALDKGFASPGGIIYLAKIYRKRKDYLNEVAVLKRALKILRESSQFRESTGAIEERLEKANSLLNKDILKLENK